MRKVRHWRRCSRMRRSTIGAADAWSRECERRAAKLRAGFATLTYALPDAWQSRHVSECLKRCRHWCERRGIDLVYEWVAEIQEGRAKRTGDHVVHYHLIIWLPVGVELPKFDQVGWWPHGFTKMEWARNPVGYCASYASKLGFCEKFPRGLRLHGRGGMGLEVARQVRCWVAPRYVRDRFGLESDPVRLRGGGWVDRCSGEVILPSEVPRLSEWVFSYASAKL